jgi:hypothetical protein
MAWRAPQSLTAGTAPPPDYYAANLRHLTAFVGERFAGLLDAPTARFVSGYEHLDSDAQRLLARLLSRKGPVFRADRLTYTEVADPAAALAALDDAGFIALGALAPADRLLNLALHAELRAWFPLARAPRKADLICALLSRYSDEQLRDRMHPRMPWLTVPATQDFQRCQWLYFGDRYQSVSVFVTEDLGLQCYPQYEMTQPDWLTAQKDCLAQHEQLYRLTSLSHGLAERSDCHSDPRSLANALVCRLRSLPLSREQRQVRDRALLRAGAWLERLSATEDALAAYESAGQHPARERRVRLLWRLGSRDQARALQAAMRQDPLCAAEADFAARFQQPRRPAPTARKASLLETTPRRIEQFAAQLVEGDGSLALHLENQFPRGLAGLAYWPSLYAAVPGAFSRPYQNGPNDLYWADFAQQRHAALQAQETQLCENGKPSAARWHAVLSERIQTFRGTANPLVHWQIWTEAFLARLLDSVPADKLQALASFTIRNLDGYRTGFPDLLVLGPRPGCFELLEVKGPNDALQGHQRRWLSVLESLGWPAQVFKLQAGTRPAAGSTSG